ncbi:MAG: alpha-amylase family glycosyl hydrolase [Bacilli bacterium]|nr:alpha-amylase family glycosyl hydrolase [Bacilli bacterium]
MNILSFLDDYMNIVMVIEADNFILNPSKLYIVDKLSNKYCDTKIIKEEIKNNSHIYYINVLKSLIIGDEYYITDNKNIKSLVEYRFITKTKRFEKEFFYDDDDLGSTIKNNKTSFKLWAPTANKVALKINGFYHDMKRIDKGIWYYKIDRDCQGEIYNYVVNVNGQISEVVDPYAKVSSANSTSSIVVDVKKVIKKINRIPLSLKCNLQNSIIYELSVYDFSNEKYHKNKGKFVSFTEEGLVNKFNQPVGIDYLKYLGITHVQLMPIIDFATKDELNPHKYYNWGYDPVQYFCFEGSYIKNIQNYESGILEVLQMINMLHKNNIGVILDLVYNHVYNVETNSLNLIVPYYYFLYDKNCNLSNGSMCGNDFDSRRLMACKLIIDSINYLQDNFLIDGIRLDLMGILDIETINAITKIVKSKNEKFLIYGEGWNNGSSLDSKDKSTFMNAKKISRTGFFNDYFRDNILGQPWSSSSMFGYALGDLSKVYYAIDVLKGHHSNDFVSPLQSINYLESHDGLTMHDKIVKECGEYKDDVAILALSMLLLAQGIPFLHMGQEVKKDKNMYDNTYLNPNNVNNINYDLINDSLSNIKIMKELINFRKNNPDLFFDNYETIEKNVTISEYYKVIIYEILGDNHQVKIVYNGTNYDSNFKKMSFSKVILSSKSISIIDGDIIIPQKCFVIFEV